MASKPICERSWCWGCGNVLTCLLNTDLTLSALVDLVIPQPAIFVTPCVSLVYTCVCAWWLFLYYLPDVICVDQQACSTAKAV